MTHATPRKNARKIKKLNADDFAVALSALLFMGDSVSIFVGSELLTPAAPGPSACRYYRPSYMCEIYSGALEENLRRRASTLAEDADARRHGHTSASARAPETL
jgi:hypothetical protein